MTQSANASIDDQLNTRARAPHYDAVNAAYASLSTSARSRLLRVEGVEYGDHPLEKLDLLHGPGRPRGVIVWFHGGFWRARDRADFHFLADGFARLGLATIAVGYPKVPAVTLRRIVAASHAAVDASRRLVAEEGLSGLPVFAGGHSAGAHLATMAALARPEAFAGLIAVSGLYDLEPVRQSFANADLRLDEAEAQALSPVKCAGASARMPAAVFLVGSDESAEFHTQARAMTEAWQAGGAATYAVVPVADHYTILFALHGGAPSPIASLLNHAAPV